MDTYLSRSRRAARRGEPLHAHAPRQQTKPISRSFTAANPAAAKATRAYRHRQGACWGLRALRNRVSYAVPSACRVFYCPTCGEQPARAPAFALPVERISEAAGPLRKTPVPEKQHRNNLCKLRLGRCFSSFGRTFPHNPTLNYCLYIYLEIYGFTKNSL